MVALFLCFALIGCGSTGHSGHAVPSAVKSGSVTTGGGGASVAPGANGSAAPGSPGSPAHSTGLGSAVPGSPAHAAGTGPTIPQAPANSALPTYNGNSVRPTTKPAQSGGGPVSLGNIGSPTIDSQHPNGSAGHAIPWAGTDTSPHCILIYNTTFPQRVTIAGVTFHSDVAGPGDAGPLQFVADNTNQNCGWLAPGMFQGVRSPTCGGVTLPLLTGRPFAGPACVLRLDVPAPDSNADRIGHFNFILQTKCVDRAVAPCSLLANQPTAGHPVTVQWSPPAFYVAACGPDAREETDAAAAQGKCLDQPSSTAAP